MVALQHTPASRSANPALAIQDYYPEPYRHCYGCGPDNKDGWHIKSYWDDESIVAYFTPADYLTGGVPNNLFGGVLAAVSDCHGTASAAAFSHHAMGHTLGVEPLLRCVTGQLTVNFRKPTPMGRQLVIRARLVGIEGRKVTVDMEISCEGDVTCTATMLAIRLKE